MAQADIHALRGLEAEVIFENAQDHDADGHDGRLGVFGRGKGRVWALSDGGGEGAGQDVVDFFEEGFTSGGEGAHPGGGHTDTLNALACGAKVLAYRMGEIGGEGSLPGKKRAVMGGEGFVDVHRKLVEHFIGLPARFAACDAYGRMLLSRSRFIMANLIT